MYSISKYVMSVIFIFNYFNNGACHIFSDKSSLMIRLINIILMALLVLLLQTKSVCSFYTWKGQMWRIELTKPPYNSITWSLCKKSLLRHAQNPCLTKLQGPKAWSKKPSPTQNITILSLYMFFVFKTSLV